MWYDILVNSLLCAAAVFPLRKKPEKEQIIMSSIILASQSPRRQELIARITEDFEVIVAEEPTELPSDVKPEEAPVFLASYKAGSVAVYVSNYTMTAHGRLEMKEGRYRVTVDRIVFQTGPDTTLETYALNKRMEFKPVFVSMNAAKAIDYELTRLFTIKTAEKEDW